MESFVVYLIKVNVALIVLYTFYRLSFSKDTFFKLRRVMLLLICITSFTYPFFDFSIWMSWSNNSLGQTLSTVYTKMLPEILVVASDISPNNEVKSWNIDIFLGIIYGLGAAVLVLRTVLEIIKIRSLIRHSRCSLLNGVSVYQSTKIDEPYSFFHWIFINPMKHSDKEMSEIIIHERTHKREFHSLDILLAQLIIILCWFNPFAWLIRSEIRMNHEYLADKQVINLGYDKKTYQYHLLGMEHSSLAAANIYNNFSVLPLKKRIKMLNRKRTSNIMISKYLMFIPVVALLMLFSNCTKKTEKVSPTENTASSSVINDRDTVAKVSKANNDSTVFEAVAEMPEFPNGDKALMTYLSKNIDYPANAQEKGIQGRVIIEFVINKDGSITEAKVVRSVDPELDKEALRVINKMPKWKPGKHEGVPVRVKYTIPVSYRLQ